MLNGIIIGGIRTGVPALVGWVVSWLIARGIDIPSNTRDWLVGLLTFAILLAYYFAVRFLEEKWPAAGVLLGVPQKPVYGTGATVVDVEPTAVTTTTTPDDTEVAQ